MAPDLSQWPLLVLMEHVDEWVKAARSPEFWDPEADFRSWAERLWPEAKDIIVWLELRGQDEAAAHLDDCVAGFRNAYREFEEACRVTYPPDDPGCRDLADEMIHKAEQLSGVCEDLDAELPSEIWEGFWDG